MSASGVTGLGASGGIGGKVLASDGQVEPVSVFTSSFGLSSIFGRVDVGSSFGKSVLGEVGSKLNGVISGFLSSSGSVLLGISIEGAGLSSPSGGKVGVGLGVSGQGLAIGLSSSRRSDVVESKGLYSFFSSGLGSGGNMESSSFRSGFFSSSNLGSGGRLTGSGSLIGGLGNAGRIISFSFGSGLNEDSGGIEGVDLFSFLYEGISGELLDESLLFIKLSRYWMLIRAIDGLPPLVKTYKPSASFSISETTRLKLSRASVSGIILSIGTFIILNIQRKESMSACQLQKINSKFKGQNSKLQLKAKRLLR